MTESLQSIIEHHGVRGQRWGVRRSQRALSAARASRAADGGSSEALAGKDVKSTKGKTRYSSKPSKLSTEELKSRISRMEMEKRYNDLNKRDKRAIEVMTTNALKSAGTEVLTNQFRTAGNAGAAAVKTSLKSNATIQNKAARAKQKVQRKEQKQSIKNMKATLKKAKRPAGTKAQSRNAYEGS